MTKLTVRPMEPDDLVGVRDLFSRLSDESRYRRFFSLSVRAPEWELEYLAGLDGHDRLALIALVDDRIVGLARFHRTEDGHADVAVAVEDVCQHRGVGRRLMQELARAARREGLSALDVSVLGENLPALRLIRRMAPAEHLHLDHGVFEASISLAG